MTAYEAALIHAAATFPGSHCCDGEQHPLLMELAKENSELQAASNRCGHFALNARFDQIRVITGMSAGEIAAETWPEERDGTADVIALSFFKAWRQSPGHWDIASRPHTCYGVGVAKSDQGIWYGTITVGD